MHRIVFGLSVLAMGCSDHKVGRFNSLPEANITSHTDGAGVYEGETIVLEGRVSDPNHNMEDLLVDWNIGTEESCTDLVPDDTGSIACETTITLDSTEVILEVRDPESGSATASITLDVRPNEPPSVELLSPTNDSGWYSDSLVDFSAIVADPEDLPEDLTVVWNSDVEGDLEIDEAPDSTGSVTGVAYLSEGEHRITVTVSDTMGKSVSETELIEVGPPNGTPECSISSPFDGTIGVLGDELFFEGVTWDSDTEDPSTLDASWRSDLDGLLASTAPDTDGNISLTLNTLTRGEHLITLTVTDEADASCSDSVGIIIGTAPEIVIDSPSEGEIVNEGELLTLSATVTDGDQDPDTLNLRWSSTVDGVIDTDFADASGVATVDIDTLSRGTHILTLEAEDAHGMTGEDRVVVIINGAPSAPEISLSPDPAHTEDDLVVSIDVDSTDPEGDPISYTFAWTQNGVATSDISDTIAGGDTTRGDLWEVTVTPNDGHQSGPSASTGITVANTAPEIVSISLSPSAVYTDDSVSVVVGTTDIDGDSVSLSYLWEVDGIPVAETSDTLDGAIWFDRDEVVTVTVTPDDGSDWGDEATDSIAILNTAPIASTVTLSPTTIYTDDDVRAVVSGSDADDDGISYSYSWYVDGALVAETSATISGVDYFERDQILYVVATPDDGTDTGSSVTSSSATISNSVPVISELAFDPVAPSTEDTLTATPTATDADGDSISFDWTWTVSGTTVAETSDSLDGSIWFDKGDTIRATAVPDDGTDTGSAFDSDVITVGNAAPELVSASLSPSVVMTNDTIVATVSTTDDDGDAVSVEYVWSVDGVEVPETGDTLDGTTYFDKDQEVTLDVVLEDIYGDSSTANVGSLIVSNTPPEDPVVAIDPEEPRDGTDDIVCEITTDAPDDDDDSIDYTFGWTVDGISWTGTTDSTHHFGDTIPGTETEVGEVWTCTATADDGDDSGGNDSASATVIQGFGGWSSSVMSAADADYDAGGEDASDLAGYAVSDLGDIDGDGYDDIIIGGYGADAAGTSTGMAFILMGDSLAGTREIDLSDADYRMIGENYNDYAGSVVGSAGDVDGDGLPDVLVTAHGEDTEGTNAGKSYLFFASELSTAAELYLYDANHVFYGQSGGDHSGAAASAAGDLDGDGCDDLAFGSYGSDENANNAGAVHIWLCTSIIDQELMAADADIILYGDAANDQFGRSVAGNTDVDGDGYADIIVGADGADGGGSSSGEAYLYSGVELSSGDYVASDATIVFIGEDAGDGAGYTVAMPGDVDGDDHGDALIGAYGDDSGGSSAGKSYLFFSGALSTAGTYDLSDSDHAFIGESANDSSSIGLSGAGDVDRDGLADILVGAPMNDTAGTNSGTAYLILSDSLPSVRNIDLSTADYAFTGEANNDQHGRAVSGAGDVNGDDLDDFLIGAPYNDTGGVSSGAVYLWLSD